MKKKLLQNMKQWNKIFIQTHCQVLSIDTFFAKK